jgi:hypothetical protein
VLEPGRAPKKGGATSPYNAMAAFNSMPANGPGEAIGLNPAMAGPGLGIEGFDAEINFDDAML